ncbi:MAG TPA: hypothetical protein VGC18_12435 [Lacisediminihabitans sp.]|uniref:hypothetical protein n=1 Tax=Lacisediminihabitans sp. TaxID=2787631 RepID=UPI002EDB7068
MSRAPEERIVDAGLNLLDRQVLDVDGVPVVVVSDLELSDVPTGPIPAGTTAPVITSLLSGPVLATRIFGGRPPASRLHRIAWGDVRAVDIVVSLRVSADTLDVTWAERWLGEHVIGRIPGGRHDPE